MPRTTPLHVRKVRSVLVAVSDSERLLAFYRDVLGFEVRLDAPFGTRSSRHGAAHHLSRTDSAQEAVHRACCGLPTRRHPATWQALMP